MLERSERERGYRALSLARALDERMWRLARAGRAHFAVPCSGHEAIGTGYALAMQPGVDWLAPHYRDLAALLVLGMPARDVMLCFFSRPSDPNARGRQPYAHFGSRALHVLSQQGPQPNHCSHGVGCAWGSQLLGDGSVTVIAFGDGGAQKGEAHESMNLAAVHRLPCVFVVHRNGWTQSVRREDEYATETLVARAAGYGMPGIAVDGGDLEAMHAAAAEAIARARSGAGPTLIDAQCIRFLPNTSNDDDTRYRDRSEIEAARATQDPLVRARALVDAAWAAAVDAENAAIADDAAAWAEAQPLGDPATVLEHAYA
ncbi:2-oxoisovalerate dehydrogenase subunit alpha [Vulcanimicrobium alpinum]|uniref:2-oxoisovalerate dehydrogenase subunit alpha n=1 Tax=Vulcanimicrobium alpinum TaxID=3016050 RepID=A0AAN1XXN8_UNVUL|nr:thiamine pyrophosphate-dependent dehydrogenase E1 component subunit alpha [Vulcanimicrobium alpinum]BDE07264.1 2-oxoisovalerate dehydrogenase subunit alpha [Vulcanimicrobium alpinum]